MGVSFKISSSGSRFKPKPALVSEAVAEASKIPSKNESNNSTTNTVTSFRKFDGRDEESVKLSDSSLSSRLHQCFSDHEVSFTLNLFPDGYSIGKPSEDSGQHTSVHDAPKLLHPYDRASEPLFLAIESGWLPGDIFNDIPCKYVDGGLICQVRDFRKCISDSGSIVPSTDASPHTTKVHLKMSLENVVKDISLFADVSWTYGDLMEVESRVLKALQPKLCLDPTPRLDRLCQDPVPPKLKLGLSGLRTKRMREMPDVSLTSISRLHGKRISVGRFPDSSTYRSGESASGELLPQHMQDSFSVQNISLGPSNVMTSRSGGFVQDPMVSAMNVIPQQSKFLVGNQRSTQDSLTSTVLNTPIASPVAQDMTITYNDNVNSNALPHGKLESQDGQMLSYSGKRARLGSVADTIHPQQLGSYMDSLQASDVQWKNHLLQQQANARGIQFSNTGMPRYSQIGHEGPSNQDGSTAVSLGQQGMRYGDQLEADKLDKSESIRVKTDGKIAEAESNQMDPRLQQRSSQQAFMRPNFHQAGWNNLGQQAEKDPRKEEHIQKRRASQSPRVSSSIVTQSPLSGKSSELASGLLGIQYGAVSSAIPLGPSQREKSAGMSIPSVGRSQSGICSANDSMQQQGQVAGKWRSNSLPKTPAMSGVGSPASISNVSIPMNAASPSISTGTVADQSMLEKFSKIEMVAARYKLNCKRSKTDELSRKQRTFSPQEVGIGLSTISSDEITDDDSAMPLSKSLIGGSINTLKSRVLSFRLPDRTVPPGTTPVATSVRTRLIMSEKPQDGTVTMHVGDLEDRDYLNAEDYLPSLSTPHFADLLAAQFSVLMLREGYFLDDHVQARQLGPPVVPSPNQRIVSSIPSSVNESQQYAEATSAPQMHETKPIINANSAMNSPSSNLLASTGMLSAGGNPQALQMSQGLIHSGSAAARTPQMDTQQSVSQQHALLPNNQQQQMMHQHQPQFSRSVLLPPTSFPNTLVGQNSNLPLGNSQMVNKASSLQMLQQQQQPNQQQPSPSQAQIQSQMQRKMMMGLGTAVGMGGNIANNIVGLGGLGNVMGMGSPRGIGGSSPIPGMGNMSQNGMAINQASNFTNAISQQLRSGSLTPMQAQAILASRMRITQNRGMMGGPQSGMSGMTGGAATRQMQPTGSPGLSMLSQTLHRGGGGNSPNPMQRPSMAAPRLMTGMNVHMNQQQLLQIQQQHMQHQQMQQQHQQQSVPDPQPQMQQQQEASPLQSVISAQQVSSPGLVQQQQQQASPQMSSGAMNPTSAGNPDPGPASPQLSSQTLGSVGSISNSSMDLQGVNKKSTG
ncbi:hypothetical protein V2J09_022557 [Rumex salicifolius]